MAPTLILIGSPGAGKTSVGKRVADRLHVPFVDTDKIIEAETGMSIADIFVDRGEPAFRDIEAAAVAAALADSTGVLSLGGGAVMRPETQARLSGHRVVWLKVSLNEAVRRVGLNQSRPLLLGNVRGTLAELLDKREPVYGAVATAIVDTTQRSVKQVVDDVVKVVKGE